MAYLPPCETLFPLSDDMRDLFRLAECAELCDEAMIEVPHGFLGLNELTEGGDDPMLVVH